MTHETTEIAELRVEVRHLTEAVKDLTRKLEYMDRQINRWKGAGWMALIFAGVIGGFGGQAIRKWLGG